MSCFKVIANAARQFNQDEEGSNVLESVLLVAVAAIIGLLVKAMGTKWSTSAQQLGDSVVSNAP